MVSSIRSGTSGGPCLLVKGRVEEFSDGGRHDEQVVGTSLACSCVVLWGERAMTPVPVEDFAHCAESEVRVESDGSQKPFEMYKK